MILNSRYLVGLDTLLDTRLGTVANLDQDTAATIMSDPKYMSRDRDLFFRGLPDVSEKAYLDSYKARDRFTMAASIPTHFVNVLKTMVLTDLRDPQFNFSTRKIVIHVNIAPYKLTPEEKKSLIQIVSELIPGPFEIDTRYFMPTAMSPAMLKNNGYTTVAMYDLLPWIESQKDNFADIQIPETTLIGPEFLPDKELKYDDLDPGLREKMMELGPFRSAEMLMVPYCNLFLMAASIFSCMLLPMPEKTA